MYISRDFPAGADSVSPNYGPGANALGLKRIPAPVVLLLRPLSPLSSSGEVGLGSHRLIPDKGQGLSDLFKISVLPSPYSPHTQS